MWNVLTLYINVQFTFTMIKNTAHYCHNFPDITWWTCNVTFLSSFLLNLWAITWLKNHITFLLPWFFFFNKEPKCIVRPLASLVCALIQRYMYSAFKTRQFFILLKYEKLWSYCWIKLKKTVQNNCACFFGLVLLSVK